MGLIRVTITGSTRRNRDAIANVIAERLEYHCVDVKHAYEMPWVYTSETDVVLKEMANDDIFETLIYTEE